MVCYVYSYLLKGERVLFVFKFLSTQGRESFVCDYSNVMFFLQGVRSLDDQVCRGGRGRSQSGERRYMGQ